MTFFSSSKTPGVRLWPYLRKEAASLGLAYACMALLALSGATLAFLSGPALGLIFNGQQSASSASSSRLPSSVFQAFGRLGLQDTRHIARLAESHWIPFLLLITAVVKGFAQAGQFYLMGAVSGRIARALRLNAFNRLLAQPMAFFQKEREGDLVSRLTHEIGLVEQALFYGLAPLLRDTLAVFALLGFCLYSDPKLAGVTTLALACAALPLQKFSRWLKRVSRTSQAKMGEMAAICHEAVSGVRLVQTHQGESFAAARLAKANALYLEQMQESYWVRAIRSPTLEILGTTGLAALLVFLGSAKSPEASGHFISFFAALLMMYDPLKKLGQVGEHLIAGRVALERLSDILLRAPSIYDCSNATIAQTLKSKISFQNISVAYPGRVALNEVSFDVRAGERIGIVGPSGAGKSTLAQLLPRLLDVSDGAILWDGQDVRTLSLASLRRHVTLVSQDTFLVSGTVSENIAFARPNTLAKDIVRAATAAFAHDFIMALPEGYETQLGERGQSLSGGQRQRLALARAWLRESSVLILDEASSALDNQSEILVQKAIENLGGHTTTFIIAHRLSTVERCERIFYFAEGRLTESGSHSELIAKKGAYWELWERRAPTAERFETCRT